MNSESKQQIIEIINKKGKVSVHFLSEKLKLSPQMVHRHLKDLIQQGLVSRLGSAPKTEYQSLSNGPTKPLLNKDLSRQLEKCAEILSCHPAVKLVTLFGSQARGEAHQDSDIDLLVWISSGKESFSRHDIWNYFDRHSRKLPWKDKVSLVVRKLQNPIEIQTLLLDLPEEHRLVYDSGNWFEKLRSAIIDWRKTWGAQRLPSFGGKHGWIYSTRVKNLDEIDFRLELTDVP
ncbi:MAG: winged helix-turn-helix transcriptional regulator [Proteobacteria bacterium]|nr:winged helix-turn-helix transcriptional regulator [Pseudomonadota bacterium]NDD04760.1 winged helix-turn-helix transcriptional regulator [Pseudomonadota bacterium]NDG27404.1 winged helix-turn-helix transcriptional regulator [Pseudomonadota bacterium]